MMLCFNKFPNNIPHQPNGYDSDRSHFLSAKHCLMISLEGRIVMKQIL